MTYKRSPHHSNEATTKYEQSSHHPLKVVRTILSAEDALHSELDHRGFTLMTSALRLEHHGEATMTCKIRWGHRGEATMTPELRWEHRDKATMTSELR
jgi:hypothetical protein